MNKRIRYNKADENGVCESKHIYTSKRTGAQYKIFINVVEKTYKIRNINTQHIYTGGENINNLNVLKRSVKKRLEGMGVEFSTEKRMRTFGVCPKGMTQEKWLEIKDEETNII